MNNSNLQRISEKEINQSVKDVINHFFPGASEYKMISIDNNKVSFEVSELEEERKETMVIDITNCDNDYDFGTLVIEAIEHAFNLEEV